MNVNMLNQLKGERVLIGFGSFLTVFNLVFFILFFGAVIEP